ncbi:MAG: AMMECR1 domain-containing protein [Planctomycetota bacterium]|nr:AMMECR1 domain-containing protein [Planctomycetota bacterium]
MGLPGNQSVEISVLSPLEERSGELDEIEVGRHGLLLRKGLRSGLLLPQVPVEQNWDREEFLNHLCLKAGLPPNSHKDSEAHLFRFSAEVFGESDSD